MGDNKRKYTIYLKSKLSTISKLSFSFLQALLITKCIAFIIAFDEQFFNSKFKLISKGLFEEIIFASIIAWILLLLSPIYRFKLVRKVFFIILSLLLTFELLSSFYFVITLEPISGTLLNFTFSEITNITQDYWSFKWYYFLLPLPFLSFWFLYKKQPTISSRWLVVLLLPAFFSLIPIYNTEKLRDYENAMTANKTRYFFKSLKYQYRIEEKKDLVESIELYKRINVNRKFLSETYPLLHKKGNENPLGPYFDLKDPPPNIVFIIVESLSSPYSGIHADEASFTPFLDSLSQKSITFHNFLATAERTFAVLPNVLASLPHGNKGFNKMEHNFPDFYSLPEFLFSNNYNGSFFYGGFAGFDEMDLFLKHVGFSSIIDREEYNYEGTEYETSRDPVPFGIGDKEMLASSFESLKKNKNTPYFNVYLTLSMHYPFIVDDKKFYLKKVKEIIELANEKANKEKLQKYDEELATFLYTDDALRSFFGKYKERPEFDNTIFLIVGDHTIGEIPHYDPIKKYRVPCIIFSPLLNKSKNIFAVNSHLDIPPSFISLLENRYNYSSPEKVHWLGSTFDTNKVFQNNRTLSFMLNDRKMNEFVSGKRFVRGDKVYEINHDKLELKSGEAIDDEEIFELKKAYKSIHKYVTLSNKIFPAEKSKGKVLYNESKLNESKIKGDNEFMSLMKISLKEYWTRMDINVNLSIKNKIDLEDENLPVLVVSISDKSKAHYEYKYWNIFNLKDIVYKKQNGYDLDLSLVIHDLDELGVQPGNEFNLFFWNKEKADVHFQFSKKLITLLAE